VERSFRTTQDRLVKGLRVARVKTLAAANRFLDEEFLPWWNQHLTVAPANATDAHRALGPEHSLPGILSRVETRQVQNDYTLSIESRRYAIARESIGAGLRGATVRIEFRLDGQLAARFGERYLTLSACAERPEPAVAPAPPKLRTQKKPQPSANSRASLDRLFRQPGPSVLATARIDRTRTVQRLG